jgi:hypothetical protein
MERGRRVREVAEVERERRPVAMVRKFILEVLEDEVEKLEF